MYFNGPVLRICLYFKSSIMWSYLLQGGGGDFESSICF